MQDISAEDAWAIVDKVKAKTYVRSDLNQSRCGFLAQDLQKVCKGAFASIVGETDEEEDGEKYLTVDYSRCVTLLFRTNQDLLARVQALEKLVKSKG